MIPQPVQKKFDMGVSSHAPLMPLEGAVAMIRRDAVEIVDLCDSGIIPWAFNLSAKFEPRRRDIHIFFDSLTAYQRNDFIRLDELKKMPAQKIIAAILPKPTLKVLSDRKVKTIRLVELALRFSCTPPHIANLVRTSELQLSEVQVKTPKHSPYVDYDSVVEFLARREISQPTKTK